MTTYPEIVNYKHPREVREAMARLKREYRAKKKAAMAQVVEAQATTAQSNTDQTGGVPV